MKEFEKNRSAETKRQMRVCGAMLSLLALMSLASLQPLPAHAGIVVSSACSAAFRMDTREGPFASGGAETLTYSALWHGDANATVTILQRDADSPVASGLRGEGTNSWSVTLDGTYVLTHATSGTNAVETATFVVRGLTQSFAEGDIRLTDYAGVYDGRAHTIGIETNEAIAGLTLKYAVDVATASSPSQGAGTTAGTPSPQQWSSERPQFVNVTNVVVFVEASAPGYFTTTNSATVTITKAANAWLTAPSMKGWTAGATPATPNRGQAKFGTATVAYGVAGGAAGGLGATRPSASGSYVATFTVPETENYGVLVKDVSFTIAAAPPKTYKVNFNANGGKLPKGKKMSAQTFTTGKAAKLRTNTFTRKGYVFVGWAERKDGPVAYKNGQSVKNLGKGGHTVTLYAVWAKAQYKVVFDASGGRLPKGVKMPAQTFKYGKAQKLNGNKFIRKGYVFGGWAIRDPLATVPKIAYKNGQAVANLSRDGRTVKLYAVWKKR